MSTPSQPPASEPGTASSGRAVPLSQTGKVGHAPVGRLGHGLAAIGAAAVIAVYSAGFIRTRAASEQLADDGPRRRPMPPPPAVEDVQPALDVHPPDDVKIVPVAPQPTPAAPRVQSPAAVVADVKAPAPVAAASKATAEPAAPAPAPAVTSPSVASSQEPAGKAPVAGATTADKPMAAPAAPAAAETPAAAAPAPQTPAPPAAPAVAAAPQYKDGTYTGWGTCRHGDIQATVVIAGGKIAQTTISQCWTRYPCSWIAPIVPQVVQRQSPEVDYVSGATQSTNAFYYAVIEALSKAK